METTLTITCFFPGVKVPCQYMVFDVTSMDGSKHCARPAKPRVWKLINTSKRLIPDLNRLATNSLGPTTIRQKPILLLGVERERESGEKGDLFINCNESELLSYHMKGKKVFK